MPKHASLRMGIVILRKAMWHATRRDERSGSDSPAYSARKLSDLASEMCLYEIL